MSPSQPDVAFLASDVHFRIGGQHIVLPAVAMRQPDYVFKLTGGRSENVKEELQMKRSDPAEPMKMEKADLLIRQDQYTGDIPTSR